ncbi:MAG: SUF system NifU family Fe-S cluster assembly protein [Gammaproteobacteria bacterium]|nr:MAG: SUF system NifU family Fe-S cluster assembly protein [Gammaproteobacteria bacterium]
MSDLRALYQSLIMDHGKNPRNKRPMDEHGGGCRCSEGYNPLCGDKLKLYAKTDGDTLEDLSFDGEGCAIFTASSSMLTEVLKGRSIEEIREVLDLYLKMLTEEDVELDPHGLGKLAVFGGVKEFPARVKCATLPWRALEAILEAVDGESIAE